MKKTTRSAFTLVELIVVITILAILGTIAFISLQGYSADARNSKRTSDINNIQSAISIKMAEGGGLMAFVGDETNELTTISLAGTAGTPDTNYNAGNPNYTALGVKQEEFEDPNGSEYVIGATTTAAGRFELAAAVELDGTRTSLVKGTYVPRSAANLNNTGAIDTVSGQVIVLDPSSTNVFRTGDFVTGVAAAAVEIERVARDGVTLSFADTVTITTGLAADDVITLAADETAGLITDRSVATATLVNGDDTYLPY